MAVGFRVSVRWVDLDSRGRVDRLDLDSHTVDFHALRKDSREPLPDAVKLHNVTRAAVCHDLRNACVIGGTWLLRIDTIYFGLIDSVE